MIRPFAVLALSLVALLPATAGALTINVNNPQDLPDVDPGDGVCNVDPFQNPDVFALCTLRAAVMEANATSIDTEPMVTILLKPGSNHVFKINPVDGDVTGANGDLDIARPMWIGVPEGSKTRARISGNNLDLIFDIETEAKGSTLHGLEITAGRPANGFAGKAAAAIENKSEDLLLSWLDIHHNKSNGPDRGAIYVYYGNIHLVDSSVRDNGTTEDETKGIEGGNGPGGPTIERSSIHGNFGAGIQHASGLLTLTNSTVAYNKFGGIFSQADSNISGSTIAYNGWAQIFLSETEGAAEISGSILVSLDSMVPVCFHSSTEFSSRWNLYGDTSCQLDDTDVGSKHNASVSLHDLGNWGGRTQTMPPLSGSDAVDFVDPSLCEDNVFDQRGLPRIVSYTGAQPARCDAGAVELQLPVIFSDGFDEAP